MGEAKDPPSPCVALNDDSGVTMSPQETPGKRKVAGQQQFNPLHLTARVRPLQQMMSAASPVARAASLTLALLALRRAQPDPRLRTVGVSTAPSTVGSALADGGIRIVPLFNLPLYKIVAIIIIFITRWEMGLVGGLNNTLIPNYRF